MDIKYVKKIRHKVKLREIIDVGHGEYCLRFPDKFVVDMLQMLEERSNNVEAAIKSSNKSLLQNCKML